MRFMVIRKADADTEAGVQASAELVRDMTTYHAELVERGIVKFGAGLLPSSKGSTIKFRNGKPTVTDGPFAEAKELIAGFSVFEVGSREELIDILKRWPALDGAGNVELEIRQIAEAEDFGEAYAEDLRERDAALREKHNLP